MYHPTCIPRYNNNSKCIVNNGYIVYIGYKMEKTLLPYREKCTFESVSDDLVAHLLMSSVFPTSFSTSTPNMAILFIVIYTSMQYGTYLFY